MIAAKPMFAIGLSITLLTLFLDLALGNPARFYDTGLYCIGLISFWDYRAMATTGQIQARRYGTDARRIIDRENDKAEFQKIFVSRYVGGLVVMAMALILELYGFNARR